MRTNAQQEGPTRTVFSHSSSRDRREANCPWRNGPRVPLLPRFTFDVRIGSLTGHPEFFAGDLTACCMREVVAHRAAEIAFTRHHVQHETGDHCRGKGVVGVLAPVSVTEV